MNKNKNRYFLLLTFFFVLEIFSQQNYLNIIPEPLLVELKVGDYKIKEGCTISLQKDFSEAMPLSLKQVYDFDPTYGLPTEQSKHIIGVEACLWGESVKTMDRAFYMTFPRALAFSEAGWSEMKNRNWDNFKSKIPFHLNELLNKGINYRPPVELY